MVALIFSSWLFKNNLFDFCSYVFLLSAAVGYSALQMSFGPLWSVVWNVSPPVLPAFLLGLVIPEAEILKAPGISLVSLCLSQLCQFCFVCFEAPSEVHPLCIASHSPGDCPCSEV